MSSARWPLMQQRQAEVTMEALAAVERLVDDAERMYVEAFDGALVTLNDLIEAERGEDDGSD